MIEFLEGREDYMRPNVLRQSLGQIHSTASLTNIFGLSGDINDKWAANVTFEKGRVQNLDRTVTKRLAFTAGVSYVQKDKLKASSKFEYRHDDSVEDIWQILA